MADMFGGSVTNGSPWRPDDWSAANGGGGGSDGRTSKVRKSGMSSRRRLVSHAENHEQSLHRIDTEMKRQRSQLRQRCAQALFALAQLVPSLERAAQHVALLSGDK